MSTRILLVDDDASLLALYRAALRQRFEIEVALSGEDALTRLRQEPPFAVIVADMHMGGMNGLELLTWSREHLPDMTRVMLTGDTDARVAIDAVNTGHIFQFLVKPFPPQALAGAIDASARQYQLVTAERELLEKTLNGSVKVLTEILALVEPEHFSQSVKLREYAGILGDALRFTDPWQLEAAAMLCYIGYVTIPDAVLQKLRVGLALKSLEQDMLTRVPEVSYDLLARIPRLETVALGVRYQCKNFDGTGFPPDAVSGPDIPPIARILKVVADIIELESNGLSRGKILEEMKARANRYDPRVFKEAVSCLIEAPPKGSIAIAVAGLVVGQTLLAPIETTNGTLLVAAGNQVSHSLLEKVKNFAQLNQIKEPIYVAAPLSRA